MLTPEQVRLAVWGDPIAHSRSPQLHLAAYRALGLPWTYDRRRVGADEFADALGSLDSSWRGLSLTMPLKAVAFQAATRRDRRAELTGAVNTLLLDSDGPRGFNTDVGGVVAALRDAGTAHVDAARIVGAGATATSALVALAEFGARHVEVVARRPLAVVPLMELGERLGVAVAPAPFGIRGAVVPVTIATLPGHVDVPDAAADALAASGGLLLDVVYGQGETPLASAWSRGGAPWSDGLAMLLHQAVLQVRVFTTGDVQTPLADEASVLAAMRDALVGD